MVAITALNGRLPTSALSPISLRFSLRRDAAASYLRARTAGAPAGITTAYRTLAEQDALYKRLGYPTALPAGQSQHGEGVALDLPEPARSWFVAHGAPFGWVRTIKAEPWHFEYKPALDTHVPASTPEDDVPSFDDPLGVNPATHKPETFGEQVKIASNYAFQSWELLIAQRAQVAALVGAVAALSKGEPFDEAKLLASIEQSAAAGIKAGFAQVGQTLTKGAAG